MSKTQQQQGASLERHIIETAGLWGIALWQIPTPLRILGTAPATRGRLQDPRIKLARLEPAMAVDFLGVLPGGLALALEAKTCAGASHPTSYPLDDRLRGHQGEVLSQVAQMGGVAAVILRRDAGEAGTLARPRWVDAGLWVIPWPEGDPRAGEEPRQSWAWGEIERWRCRTGWGEAFADWDGWRTR